MKDKMIKIRVDYCNISVEAEKKFPMTTELFLTRHGVLEGWQSFESNTELEFTDKLEHHINNIMIENYGHTNFEVETDEISNNSNCYF